MELEGICPECKEWTTAEESCCGMGAIVEGSLVTDESCDCSVSTFIDEATLTYGKGKLSDHGTWEIECNHIRAFPLKEKL